MKTHGGKHYLAASHWAAITGLGVKPRIVADVFGGGGSFLLNGPISKIEVFNDLDPRKANLMTVLRDRFVEFYQELQAVTWGRDAFEEAVRCDEAFLARSKSAGAGRPAAGSGAAVDVLAAMAFVVRSRMSRGGMGKTFGESTRLRGGQNEYKNAWETAVLNMPRIAWRLKAWRIHCMPAAMLIGHMQNTSDALIYLDPPYLAETRTAPNVYHFEMSTEGHQKLLKSVQLCACAVAIAGYRSEMYDAALAGWKRFEWPMKNHSGQGKNKQKRVECLWINR